MDNNKALINMYAKMNDAVGSMSTKPVKDESKGLLQRRSVRKSEKSSNKGDMEPIHHVAGAMAGIRKTREGYKDAS